MQARFVRMLKSTQVVHQWRVQDSRLRSEGRVANVLVAEAVKAAPVRSRDSQTSSS